MALNWNLLVQLHCNGQMLKTTTKLFSFFFSLAKFNPKSGRFFYSVANLNELFELIANLEAFSGQTKVACKPIESQTNTKEDEISWCAFAMHVALTNCVCKHQKHNALRLDAHNTHKSPIARFCCFEMSRAECIFVYHKIPTNAIVCNRRRQQHNNQIELWFALCVRGRNIVCCKLGYFNVNLHQVQLPLLIWKGLAIATISKAINKEHRIFATN